MGLQKIPHELHFSESLATRLNVPPLAAGEVQLWAVRLNPDPAQVERLSRLLSSSERERAGRYRFARDQRRYVVRHGFLRWLLGRHLASAPEAVRFATGPHGKPRLAENQGMHFNLSHSDEMALIGLSRDSELGIDIENARHVDDEEAIVHRLFTHRESAAYFRAPVSDRPVVFFNCWTRKEAFVKARGAGLSLSLKLFDVSVLPGEAARIVTINGDPESARAWTLLHLAPAPGFIGALAIQQTSCKVSAFIVDLDRNALPEAVSGVAEVPVNAFGAPAVSDQQQ